MSRFPAPKLRDVSKPADGAIGGTIRPNAAARLRELQAQQQAIQAQMNQIITVVYEADGHDLALLQQGGNIQLDLGENPGYTLVLPSGKQEAPPADPPT